MKGAWKAYLPHLGLLAVAVAVGLAAGAPEREEFDGKPSLTNFGPQGLAALRAWLEADGAKVVSLVDEVDANHLHALDALVLTNPSDEVLEEQDVAVLKQFVRQGGTLVYLARSGAGQEALNAWLQLKRGHEAPAIVKGSLEGDLGGTTVEKVIQVGLARGAKTLRTSVEQGVTLSRDDAAPIAESGTLWLVNEGDGEVWVAHGTWLAENQKLDLEDNLVFWSNLARRHRSVGFWERGATTPDASAKHTLWALDAQVLFASLLFAWVYGARLGPPRKVVDEKHRSSLEYVDALAGVLKRSKADAELTQELVKTTHRQLTHALQLHGTTPWPAVAEEFAVRTGAPAQQLLGWVSEAQLASHATPADFTRFSAQAAHFVARATGRERSPTAPRVG